MDTKDIGVDAAKLAGLQIDLLQKIRDKQVTVGHLEWFNKLTREERDLLLGCKSVSVLFEQKLFGSKFELSDELAKQLDLASSILNSDKYKKTTILTNVIGPQELINLGFEVKADEIPEIPFVSEDYDIGISQVLLYLTPELLKKSGKELLKVLTNLFKKNKLGKILCKVDWSVNEKFFIFVPIDAKATSGKWFLITLPIPDSKQKNYLDQTVVLRDLLRNNYKKDREMPDEYKSAIKELDDTKYAEIKAIMNNDWRKASQVLIDLKINSNNRPSFAFIKLFASLYLLVNQEDGVSARILKERYILTNSRDSDGSLICFGCLDFNGAGIDHRTPRSSDSVLFAVLLRK